MSLSDAGMALARVHADEHDAVVTPLRHDDDNGRLVGASLALALLRAIREAAYVMELDGRVTFINGAGMTHLGGGRQPHRVVGSYLWDLWPEAEARDLRQAVAEASEGETVHLTGVSCPQGATGARLCSVSISPVEDSNGQITKILVLADA